MGSTFFIDYSVDCHSIKELRKQARLRQQRKSFDTCIKHDSNEVFLHDVRPLLLLPVASFLFLGHGDGSFFIFREDQTFYQQPSWRTTDRSIIWEPLSEIKEVWEKPRRRKGILAAYFEYHLELSKSTTQYKDKRQVVNKTIYAIYFCPRVKLL